MIELLRDRDIWNNTMRCFRNSDFYHTYDYHHISKNKDEDPVLLHYNENGKSISLPLIIRNIKGTPYKDITCVYGYAGPVSMHIDDTFDNSKFRKELKALFEEHKVISAFSRLNPFVPYQETILNGMGEIISPGNVVNIDLTKSPEDQLSQYHKRLRTYINKSRRTYAIREGYSQEDLTRFIELYLENMRRVNAKSKYFFKPDYFTKLMASPAFQTDLLLAVSHETKEIVAGALFTKKNKIVQYHLSGVSEDYLHLNPIKMLIDEMRIRATYEGYHYMNLGGGVANKEDTLLQFKLGFSNDVLPFNIWRYVVNQPIYDELVRAKDVELGLDSAKICEDFFPCYRREAPVPHK